VVKKLSVAYGGKVRADLPEIDAGLTEYSINHEGRYPERLDELTRPDKNGRVVLRAIPKDPWKREYGYEPPNPARQEPRVFTLGKDGQPGGTGDDADVDDASIRVR